MEANLLNEYTQFHVETLIVIEMYILNKNKSENMYLILIIINIPALSELNICHTI